jgi:hypothetical protein
LLLLLDVIKLLLSSLLRMLELLSPLDLTMLVVWFCTMPLAGGVVDVGGGAVSDSFGLLVVEAGGGAVSVTVVGAVDVLVFLDPTGVQVNVSGGAVLDTIGVVDVYGAVLDMDTIAVRTDVVGGAVSLDTLI